MFSLLQPSISSRRVACNSLKKQMHSEKALDYLVTNSPSWYFSGSKDKVCWTTFLWKALGAKFSLLWLGQGMKGRMLYLHLCSTQRSGFKDERSLQFRGYKVRCRPNCWASRIILLEAEYKRAALVAWSYGNSKHGNINFLKRHFVEDFGQTFNGRCAQNANCGQYLLWKTAL